MVDAVVIILCSTLFHHSLYQLFKHVLVRRLFEPLVRWRTGRATLTLQDGDVAHLSMLVVSFTNGIVGSICSMIVVWQAREDCLLSKSPLLVPCTHWIAQYMIYDNYAMYDADYLRKDIKRYPTLGTRMLVFVKKRWSMILHHFLLLGFGYVLVVYPEVRNNVGDFIIGVFFLRELWNPLQNLAQILKLLQMQESFLYYANGISLVLVQLVVRVLNWPIVIVIYAAQYHQWDVVKALYSLYPLCIISTGVWQVLEIYWFWMIIQLVAGFTKKKSD